MIEDFRYVWKTFGGYQLTSGIRETASSVVYESTHPINCNKLAIKFIKKSTVSEEASANEVEINKDIDCDYIMPIEDIIMEVPSEFYCGIVMIKATGCDLYDLLEKNNGPLPESIVVQVAYAGLMALKYLHGNGICHRDIKIENFFIMDSNVTELDIVLADLGHACRFEPGEKMNFHSIGTLEYLAPEIFMGKEYDQSIDIWSLGCLIYTLLAYQTPFGGPRNDSRKAIIEFIEFVLSTKEPEYEKYPWNKISLEAKDFVKSMIKFEPNERASIDDLLQHRWFSCYRANYGRQEARRENSRKKKQLPGQNYLD